MSMPNSPNKKPPRLIALDMDGTLLAANGNVSAANQHALQRAHTAGHCIIIVTGRSYRTAVEKLTCLPFISQVICSNGAYEYKIDHGIVWQQALSAESAQKIATQLLQSEVQLAFGWESAQGLFFETAFTHMGTRLTPAQNIRQLNQLDQPIFKLYVQHLHLPPVTLYEQIKPILMEKVEASTSGAPFLELTRLGVDKASGLAKVASALGFSAAETIVAGDNNNDLPMFTWAGTSIAMGNAIDAVKAQATQTTIANEQDGIAVAVQALFEQGEL